MSRNKPQLIDRVILPLTAVVPVVVSSEAVSIPAGAAGTIKDFYFSRKPILNSQNNWIGAYADTSMQLTSLCFTTQVPASTPDTNLSNGDYWIDYVTGHARGKKATTATSATATYYVFMSAGSVVQVVEETVTVTAHSGTLAHTPLLVQNVYLSAGGVTGTGVILPSTVAPANTKEVKITMTTGVLNFLAGDAITQAKVTYLYQI